MTRLYESWMVWFACMALLVVTGFVGGWSTLDIILLGVILFTGLVRLFVWHHKRKLRQLKAMPLEEREKFLAQFDPKTRRLWEEQINSENS